MKTIKVIILALTATIASAQSVRVQGPVEAYNITAFPLYGRLLTPDDSQELAIPGFVRADAAGTAKFECQGNLGQPITLNLVAGEFIPCKVSRVWANGTSATPLHLFY